MDNRFNKHFNLAHFWRKFRIHKTRDRKSTRLNKEVPDQWQVPTSEGDRIWRLHARGACKRPQLPKASKTSGIGLAFPRVYTPRRISSQFLFMSFYSHPACTNSKFSWICSRAPAVAFPKRISHWVTQRVIALIQRFSTFHGLWPPSTGV